MVYLYMSGGMTHMDTFDPKPGHENQGPVRSIRTSADARGSRGSSGQDPLPLDQVLYSPSKRPFTVSAKGKPLLELLS